MTVPETQDTCTHDWQPIQGWYARYRCTKCFAIGLKRRSVEYFGSAEVTPYLCTKRSGGKPCGKAVVYSHVDEPAPRLCPAHEKERQAKLAKKNNRSKR